MEDSRRRDVPVVRVWEASRLEDELWARAYERVVPQSRCRIVPLTDMESAEDGGRSVAMLRQGA
jgi:hypothetical protein